jgi:transposase
VLNLTYEFKAIPTPEQVQLIEHSLNVCRKVWNFALRERKDWINSGFANASARLTPVQSLESTSFPPMHPIPITRLNAKH